MKKLSEPKGKMRHENARDKIQLNRMKILDEEKKCFFCNENYKKVSASPKVFETKQWYIKKNDFPYKGSSKHYLIVPKRHMFKVSDLHKSEWEEFSKIIKWLEKKLKLTGYSIFVRAGEMQYTGATMDHLHFHLLVGARKKTGSSKLKDKLFVTLGYIKR